jgi:hypothetical protein
MSVDVTKWLRVADQHHCDISPPFALRAADISVGDTIAFLRTTAATRLPPFHLQRV